MSILQDDIMNIDETTITAKVSIQPHNLSFMMSKWLRGGMNSHVATHEVQNALAKVRIIDFKPEVIKEIIDPLFYPSRTNKFVLQEINERKFFYYIKETKYSKPIGFLIEI